MPGQHVTRPFKDTLLAALDEQLVLALTDQLVRIPTRNPPGEERAGAEWIAATLRGWGIEAELVTLPDPSRPQVVARIPGDGSGPTVILNGHIDTVSEGELQAWHTPPFQSTVRHGKLYGLGVCDMKGALALAMVILKTIHESEITWPGTLLFHAAMGEEMAEDGTRTLLRQGFTGDYAIVLEPTDLRVTPATRGVIWHKVTLRGRSIHCGVAQPSEPDLTTLFAEIVQDLHTYHVAIAHQTHPLLASPSCRVTEVRAGERHNHIPDSCTFTVDRRMLPHESYAQVRAELEQIIATRVAATPYFSYSIEFLRGNEPVEISLDSPLVTLFQRNARHELGRDAPLWGAPYGSDVRNFIVDAGIPAVNFGAGDFLVCHKPNEHVAVADLMAAGRIVFATVLDLIGEAQ